MSELLNYAGKRLGLRQLELSDRLHGALKYARYLVLVALIVAFVFSSEMGERWAEIEPFKSTFFVAPWTRQWPYLTWWVLLVVVSLFWFRPFCRYLCPLGAALALPSSWRASSPYRRAFCSSCQICTRGCEPRAIDSKGIIDSRECLSCMECEANFHDEAVCPPLVGLQRLQTKRRKLPLLSEDESRWNRLRQQAEPVTRFSPPLPPNATTPRPASERPSTPPQGGE